MPPQEEVIDVDALLSGGESAIIDVDALLAGPQPGQPGYRAPNAPPPTNRERLEEIRQAQAVPFRATGVGPAISRTVLGNETGDIGQFLSEQFAPKTMAMRMLDPLRIIEQTQGMVQNAQEAAGSITPDQGMIEQIARASTAIPVIGPAMRSAGETLGRGDFAGGLTETAAAAEGGLMGLKASRLNPRIGRVPVAPPASSVPTGSLFRMPGGGATFEVLGSGERGTVQIRKVGTTDSSLIHVSKLAEMEPVTPGNTAGAPQPHSPTAENLARARRQAPPERRPPPLEEPVAPSGPSMVRVPRAPEGVQISEQSFDPRTQKVRRADSTLRPLSAEASTRTREIADKQWYEVERKRINPMDADLSTDLDKIPAGVERDLAENIIKVRYKRYADTDKMPLKAEFSKTLPEELQPYADAVYWAVSKRVEGRLIGQQNLKVLNIRHAEALKGLPDSVDGHVLTSSKPGSFDIVQTKSGKIVGGAQVHSGELEMISGGREMNSPYSAKPIYSKMDELGVERNDFLTDPGKLARKGELERLDAEYARRRGKGVGEARSAASGSGSENSNTGAGSRNPPPPLPAARAASIEPAGSPDPQQTVIEVQRRISDAESRMSQAGGGPDWTAANRDLGIARRDLEAAGVASRGEPPVPDGHIRLYRGQAQGSTTSDNFFTPDQESARGYADAHVPKSGKREIVYVDVLEETFQDFESGVNDVGITETQVPSNIAARATRVPGLSSSADIEGRASSFANAERRNRLSRADQERLDTLVKSAGVKRPPSPVVPINRERPAEGSIGRRQIGYTDRLLRPSEDVVLKAGNSRAALEIAAQAPERERILAGKWEGELQDVFQRGLGGNLKAFERVAETLDGTREIGTLTPKEAAAFERLQPLLKEVYGQAQASTFGQIKPQVGNYFPHISAADPPSVKARVAKIMDANPDMDQKQAIRIATRQSKEGYFQDPNLIREREGGMTNIRKDPAALSKYLRDAARHIAQSEASTRIVPQYKMKDGVKTAVGAEVRLKPQEMISRVTRDIANIDDRKYVQKFMENELGLREDSGLVVKGARAVMQVQAAVSLMLSPVSQPLSLGVLAGRTSIRSTAKGVKRYLSARKDYELQAMKGGSLEANLGSELTNALGTGGWTAKLPWIKGMNSMDKGLRVIADISARAYLEDLVAASKKGDATATRIMKEFDVKDAGLADSNKFARQIVDETQGRFTAGTTPNWMNTPAGRMSMQFTRLLYNQNKTIMKIAGEAQKGNVKPLARLLVVGAAAGELTSDVKAVLQGYGVSFVGGNEGKEYKDIAGPRPVSVWDNNKTHEQNLQNLPPQLAKRLAQDLGRAATGGLAQMVLDRAIPATEGQGKTLAELSGPVGGTAERLLRAGVSNTPGRNLAKEALSTLGPPGRQLAREAIPPKGAPTDYRSANPGWIGRIRDVAEGKTSAPRALAGGFLGDETAATLGIKGNPIRELARETETLKRATELSNLSRSKKAGELKDTQEVRDDAKATATRAEYRNRIRAALVAGHEAEAKRIVREARRRKIKISLDSVKESLEE